MTQRPSLGPLVFFAVAFSLATYFTFAAIQGDYGVFHRAEIIVEARELNAELVRLESEVARMENLAKRMSDSYLDLDLLDQQARDILGLLRADEIVVQ